MAINKFVLANYAHERNTPAKRRGRFIAPTADLSALDGIRDIQMIQ